MGENGEIGNVSDLNLQGPMDNSRIGLDAPDSIWSVRFIECWCDGGKDLDLMVSSPMNLNASSAINVTNIVQEGCEGMVNDVDNCPSLILEVDLQPNASPIPVVLASF